MSCLCHSRNSRKLQCVTTSQSPRFAHAETPATQSTPRRSEMHPTTQRWNEDTTPQKVQEGHARAKLTPTYGFNRNSRSAMRDVMTIAGWMAVTMMASLDLHRTSLDGPVQKITMVVLWALSYYGSKKWAAGLRRKTILWCRNTLAILHYSVRQAACKQKVSSRAVKQHGSLMLTWPVSNTVNQDW